MVLSIGADEVKRRHLSLTQPICQLVENGIFEYFSMSERRRASDQDQDKIYPLDNTFPDRKPGNRKLSTRQFPDFCLKRPKMGNNCIIFDQF